MAFTALDVKKLREMTNVGMMDCKKALQATDGDMDKAVDWLREKGLAKAAKKADRVAAEGVAYAAVVNGTGVIIEVNSETDFAAKTDSFLDLVKNLATVVATENPADVDHELQVQVALMDNDPKMANKPAQIKEKIAAGKINAFYKENCLLQQDFVRSDLFQGSVEGYIADAAKKLGGSVKFVDAIHYVKGEGIEKKVDDFAAEVAAQIAGAK